VVIGIITQIINKSHVIIISPSHRRKKNMPNSTPLTLPIAEYRLLYQTPNALPLNGYTGSAWRGAFGHALKKSVCITGLKQCQSCLLKHQCAYSYLFETPIPPNSKKMRLYTHAPHPFVIQPPQEEKIIDGFIYPLHFSLFGDSQRYLPYAIHGWQQLGQQGIGVKRQMLELVAVEQFDSAQANWVMIYQPGGELSPLPISVYDVPALPQTVDIHLQTPVRITTQDKPVSSAEFSFSAFFSHLLRRISMLTYFHTETPLDIDFASLVDKSRAVPLAQCDLQWYDWKRYSSRQTREIKLGGLTGSFSLTGDLIADFWPYLWLGQHTHVGKATSMGMGKYHIKNIAT